MKYNLIQTLAILGFAVYLFKIDHPTAGGFTLFIAACSLTFVTSKEDDTESK